MNKDLQRMVGHTIVSIDGMICGSDEVIIKLDNGDTFKMCHYRDCCESVEINDVIGDVEDLIGTPLLKAEEITNADFPPTEDVDETYTWTFYKFATIKGSVDLRWFGTSNGFYSEEVNIEQIGFGDYNFKEVE